MSRVHFHIVATGYNCKSYVSACINSALAQTYSDFTVHVVDDGSTDGTADECVKFASNKKVQLYLHKENMGAAFRRMQVIRQLWKDDVVLLLGLDDRLTPNCLERVAKEYAKGKLMTYGNWQDQNGFTLPANFDFDFDEQTHRERNYRRVKYRSTAPNTFKVFLFNRIPDTDFRIDGKWIDTTTESETMFSCLEMCGRERIGIIKDVIYIYNRNRKGGTLDRLGTNYKMSILAKIMARPKKELYKAGSVSSKMEHTAEVVATVALPVYHCQFAWFAMESLCRQETNHKWELIVYEDAEKPNGKKFYTDYLDRMKNCIRIIYIYTKERVPLAQKWCIIARHADSNSKCTLLQAGDDYSQPDRIEKTVMAFIQTDIDWYDQARGQFYNLRTKQTMLYTKGENKTGVCIAIKTSLLKSLVAQEVWQSVDHWLYTSCFKINNDLKMFTDISDSYKFGLFTDGAERISKQRKLNYNMPQHPFSRSVFPVSTFLPNEICYRLNNGIQSVFTQAHEYNGNGVIIGQSEKQLKVLNICTSDWANYMHDNAKSLQAAGVSCSGMKLIKHNFDYSNVLPVVTPQEMMNEVMSGKYNVLQLFNSDATLINCLKNFKGKKVVYHTGSAYRAKPTQLNAVFNPIIDKAIIALGEFAQLGAKNYSFISVSVDVPRPAIDRTNTMKFLHCPSNPIVKGTNTIVKLMKNFPVDFKCDKTILPHPENIKRMKECDIYIELLNPEINGNKYGSFGTTAAEAAMLGKIVITQNLSADVYEQNYGSCPLILVKDEHDFIEKVRRLLSLSPLEIFRLKREHQQWAIEKHSYLATGLRLKRIINEL